MRRESVESHRLPDQSLLLFEQTSGLALPVNESGARIWALCDGTRTMDAIVDELLSHYEVCREQIERDAQDFLAKLVSYGLLSPEPVAQ
jgi:coenzyme PQQ synthesis protein D (PqqD)